MKLAQILAEMEKQLEAIGEEAESLSFTCRKTYLLPNLC